MNNRTRLLLVVVFVVVIIGVVAAFLVLGQQPTQPAQPQNNGGVSQEPTREPPTPEPANTPLPTITPIPFIPVVIAVQDIPRGLPIQPDAVSVLPIPEQSAPFQAFTNPDEVIGKIARTDIFREQPVLANLLVEDLTSLANVGSDAAAVLPTNRVAVSLPMDRITSVAYAIQPGDRVDLIVSMLFIDVDPTFQTIEPNAFRLVSTALSEDGTLELSIGESVRGEFSTRRIPQAGDQPVLIAPSEAQRPRLTTQRTIQDALVVWTGDFPRDGRIFRPAPTLTPTPDPDDEEDTDEDGEPVPTEVPPRPDIVTLAVSPQDAVVISWLVEAGLPITFALRSASATSLVQTDPVTLDYILNRFRIDIPEKFEYNIQPAIRSIRQIEVGNRITLGG